MSLQRSIVYLLTSILFVSCSTFQLIHEHDQFIHVQGSQFVEHGRPYYFAGTNLWYACYLGSPGETGDRARLLRELDTLRAHNIINLRILAASEESYIRRSIKPGIQRAAGVVDDSLLQGLDFVLAEIVKRHMYAVLYLNNYWEWSGGMAQYMVWATGAVGADPEDTTRRYIGFMDFSAKFYSTPRAIELYDNYVKRIVTRKNIFTGRTYSDDPAIMAWELANEPRPGWGGPGSPAKENLPVFYAWIDRTARYIHLLDPNHLVTTGSEGLAGCLQSEECVLETNRSPAIDYMTMHVWPLNWGWFNPRRMSETLPTTEENAVRYINLHLQFARTLQKPIVMEEFGFVRDSAKIFPGDPTTARDHYYSIIFNVLYDSAKAGSPLAGSNFWTWGGECSARHPDGYWHKGDPFVGDPPQEPQGRNSIFNSDTSTLRIISDHALKMRQLGTQDSFVVQIH